MDKKIDLCAVLREQMQAGEVHFAYRKKSGELRIAKGTTALEKIPSESHPKGSGGPKSKVQAYWDLNSEGWRAFNPECLVWVKDVGNDNLTQEERDAILAYCFNL